MKYPWKSGTNQYCTQGQNTCSTGGSHCAQPDTYAWDFGLPLGTDVYAVKSGTVKNIYWGSQPGSYCYTAPCDAGCINYFNGIYVTHNDGSGTMGIYIHLSGTAPMKADHATAWKIGDPVNQGDVIGQSGESGYTCNNAGTGPGPHLHFQVGADSMTYSNSVAGALFAESVPNPVAGNLLTSTNAGTPPGLPYDNTDVYATGCTGGRGPSTFCTAYRSYDGYVEGRMSDNCPTFWSRYTCNVPPCSGAVRADRSKPSCASCLDLSGNGANYSFGNWGQAWSPQINRGDGMAYDFAYSYGSPWLPDTILCSN